MEANIDSKLKVSLTTKDLLIYGITFMIPVAPLAFYGSFLQPANGMVSLAYFIGMVAMLFTGFSYATMSSTFPYSGSVYTYVQQGTNAGLGFIGGWGITLDYFLIPAITYLISQSFGESLLPWVPGWVWIIVLVIFNTWINILGSNIVTKISWILFGLQAIVLGAFILGTLRLLITGAIQPHVISWYNPTHFNISGVLQATGIVIVSYLGFDAISTLSEEAENPRHSVGRAIIFSIIAIGLLFVIVTTLAGFVAPAYQNLNPDTAFLRILQQVGGTWLVKLADITIILSFGFASGQEGQTAISRILYAMGRDGILPNSLAKLHKNYKTPTNAIVLVGIISLIISLTLSQTTVSNLVSFGALFGFILLNLSVIWKFYIKGDHSSLLSFIKYAISPFIGFAVSTWIFLSLSIDAKILGAIWIFLGLGILITKTRFFKTKTPSLDFSNKN
ncbi:APC family permease [Liquorilactobacillus satsumensis]|uniref:APC family permease n=1 Tax=Liquorilactobacillus satsumensis TaxID=259059 RepID=UPI001E480837|nr:APC family permease [Liquorilactobacillus satsumensis]MCC7666936.1 amino acid transporter [Liquorilactobacillus satsumensis]MCP9357218.1 APC family permease [Liquorilactobacillus satsumensis]MCP9371165.1 APC family permease [Liquorilactobacillus satsumensis]